MSTFIKYENGVVNLDQVTDVVVDSSGQFTFNLTNGEAVVFGTTADTKASGLLALVRMTRAVDTEVYDTRNY